ncbi:MAG TPA: L-histidine N(alpha)-methyltransferase [Rhodocyclaceae bacterium]|nr:L-histidine N(alpha)-methyltransferase [Rhodocyclaceae bacterium]
MNAPHPSLHDLRPPTLDLAQAMIEGLSTSPKAVEPKFFYDARGSALFDQICAQPEYYLPAAEREIFAAHAPEIAASLGDGVVLIEPGAGSAIKIRWLLEHCRPGAYVPVDISQTHLTTSVAALARAYPWLRIHAAIADYTHSLPIPAVVPAGPRAAFFPGSSLGNFEPGDAVAFLRLMRSAVGRGGHVIIGVDRKKDRTLLDAAYNDAAGVTARFNLNLLHRANAELGADFELDGYTHKAFYNAARGRIEMHLVSRRPQVVRINGNVFQFAAGESLHTENSYKYRPEEFIGLAERAGLWCHAHWTDARAYFGVYLLTVG